MDKVTLVFIFIMALCIIGLMFCFYMLARNEAIHEARLRFIDYFYQQDPDEYAAGKRFHDALPSYDEMFWKFWVCPLSKFYPAYRNRNRNK